MSDILLKIIENKQVDFYLGGYGNFDTFAYSCCKSLKQSNKNINLHFITPYITLDYQTNHLKALSKDYDTIIYPQIEDKPLRYAITYRNQWMIDKADIFIACVTRKYGGAYKTLCYAKRKGKTIYMFE